MKITAEQAVEMFPYGADVIPRINDDPSYSVKFRVAPDAGMFPEEEDDSVVEAWESPFHQVYFSSTFRQANDGWTTKDMQGKTLFLRARTEENAINFDA